MASSVSVSRSKPLSWPEIRARAAAFAEEWSDSGHERQQAQTFWIRFLECFGVRPERVATFEHTVTRFSTQARGYVDLFWPGVMLVEQKGAGRDLEAAEFQAMDYLPGLKDHELPKIVVICDFQHFKVRDLATGEVHAFSLAELPDAKNLDLFAFIAGYSRAAFGSAEEEEASVKAAQLMGSLYEVLRLDQYPDEAASIFLTRLLFLMFGDDTALWEPHLFQEYIRTRTAEDGSDLGAQLAVLFQVLDTEHRSERTDEVAKRFPYVNGHLFSEALPIPYFDAETRDLLLRCCTFNWGSISPAVFGSMFQAVKSRDARRELGAHYTTETNIAKTIRPLFLDDLHAQRDRNWSNRAALTRMLEQLSEMRFMDPACGCGNFLVVAYRELRALELDIRVRIRELSGTTVGEFVFAEQLSVGVTQFYGIELEWWPAKIAEVAMFLVDHLANQALAKKLGWAPSRLPLKLTPKIVHDNALAIDWADVLPPSDNVIVLGNPPFLGHDSRSVQQAEELRALWGKDIGRIDYVTGWYAKALEYFGSEHNGRWAFVSTNSISQGQPVPLVFGRVFAAGWQIAFAHRTFAWTSEAPGAAAVHCVIIGFTRASPATKPTLYDYADLRAAPMRRDASSINAYLIDGPNILVQARSKPISPELKPVSFGSRPNDGGGFIVESEDHAAVASDPIAAKYLRRFVGARELLHDEDRWVLWLKHLDTDDLAGSPLLRERIERVRRHRLASARVATQVWADRPTLFDFDSQPTVPFLAIPSVSSETRRYLATQRFPADVIASSLVYTAPDADGFIFAMVSSAMFMSWQKAVGGRLKSDIRFSNTLVWNNFPLPAVDQALRTRIAAAGEAVLAARDQHPERTLAKHYNASHMDPDLYKAHAELDALVDKAFGARGRQSDAGRQTLLFNSYADLVGADQLVPQENSRPARRRS